MKKLLDRTIKPEFYEHMKNLSDRDLRIGQMFYILLHKAEKDGVDFFNAENDVLMKYIKELDDGRLFEKT